MQLNIWLTDIYLSSNEKNVSSDFLDTLYNSQSTDYKNALVRENSWTEIGEKLSVSADTAKKR